MTCKTTTPLRGKSRMTTIKRCFPCNHAMQGQVCVACPEDGCLFCLFSTPHLHFSSAFCAISSSCLGAVTSTHQCTFSNPNEANAAYRQEISRSCVKWIILCCVGYHQTDVFIAEYTYQIQKSILYGLYILSLAIQQTHRYDVDSSKLHLARSQI